MFKYNDYELIYMIKENDDTALNLMYEKYTPYIYKIIREMNIFPRFVDDFLQEGYICLYNAIKTYDMNYNKTFFKYFEIILKRRYYRLYSVYKRIDIPIEDLDLSLEENVKEYNYDIYRMYDIGLSLIKDDLEKNIYIGLYQEGLSYIEISQKYNIDIKKIYNTVQKFKKILNKNING
ncbi:MAG: sigma-70 family RNA polymerase sigma factor [Anaeroplasmataceae bacterium]